MNLVGFLSELGAFWQEKTNAKILRWTILFIIVQIVLILYRFNELPPIVPFYYSLPWGDAQLTTLPNLFLLPTLSICIALINNIFAIAFKKNVPLLSQLLIFISLIFSFLCFFSIFQITNLIA